MKANQLIKGIEDQNIVSLARAISVVENEANGFVELLDHAYKVNRLSYRIGITGPPGAGKSTLVNYIAKDLIKGKRTAVIAVDPTSPFSGGALLGDRIRMSELVQIEGAFIRSMASRGSIGGLATATDNVLTMCEAFGMDYIIVETIGVGQVEVDVAKVCDTIILVLVPESGDGVQVMKAGLIEIADIVVVNKADRDGAEFIFRELNAMMHLAQKPWSIPVIKTVATKGEGISELVSTIHSHHDYLKKSGELKMRRKERIREKLKTLIENEFKEMVKNKIGDEEMSRFVDQICNGEISPFKVIDKIFNRG